MTSGSNKQLKRQNYPYTDRNICSIPTQCIFLSPFSSSSSTSYSAARAHTPNHKHIRQSQPPASAVGDAIVPRQTPHGRRSRGPEETAGAVGSNLDPAHPQLRPGSIYSHLEQGLRSGESSSLHILVNPKAIPSCMCYCKEKYQSWAAFNLSLLDPFYSTAGVLFMPRSNISSAWKMLDYLFYLYSAHIYY
jgi:hypothetical protein